MELIGDVDSELKAQVMDSVNHAYSLDEIVAETQALLSGFSLEEQKAIRQSMEAFVNDIIMADGNRCSAEQENYSKWKEAIVSFVSCYFISSTERFRNLSSAAPLSMPFWSNARSMSW